MLTRIFQLMFNSIKLWFESMNSFNRPEPIPIRLLSHKVNGQRVE